MIYLDTSAVLAHLLAQDAAPPAELWARPLVSSRLLEYETWTRLHAMGLGVSHGEEARLAIARIALLELAPQVLARALESLPEGVRTLDALHLASMHFLRAQGQQVALASYDRRLVAAARRLGLDILPL